MTYEATVHAQDATVGRVETMLRAMGKAGKDAGPFTHVDLAVAYATTAGVTMLDEVLAPLPAWALAAKRCLISIDFGTTQPPALEKLAALPFSEVRIPNGEATVTSPGLYPPATFHSKVVLFRRDPWGFPSSLVVGSANLTRSALATGSEVVSVQSWTGRQSPAAIAHLKEAQALTAWFDDAWAQATPLADLLDRYKAKYRRKPTPRTPPEERTPLTKVHAANPTQVAGQTTLVHYAAAKSLWFETSTLYKNRGPHKAGNQLDTSNGTRAFFGFGAQKVAPNTVLGHVAIEALTFRPVKRSVRHGDNSMDKINLPVPGTDGPPSYDNKFLIFDRTNRTGAGGYPLFTLTVTDAAGLKARKAASANSVDLTMNSGRQAGLLF